MDQEIVGSHISRQFNADLEDLKSHLMMMGGLVERQVQDALLSMIALTVRGTEKRVNELEVAIDEECIRILALRQPAATDLRLVMAISKAITDLERIGDEASKIAKLALRLAEEGQAPRGYVELRHLGSHVREMLHRALDAFARFDVEQALAVAQEDRAVDLEYDGAMRQMVTYMMEDPRSISRALNVAWSLRALERVGDHARNLAEQVIYLVKGQDIRHSNLEEIKRTILKGQMT
ncbi:MAG: phosphate signaling complex protein PhoU [Gammaproteobacteria bacterium]